MEHYALHCGLERVNICKSRVYDINILEVCVRLAIADHISLIDKIILAGIFTTSKIVCVT